MSNMVLRRSTGANRGKWGKYSWILAIDKYYFEGSALAQYTSKLELAGTVTLTHMDCYGLS
jgi:hypothetical protein